MPFGSTHHSYITAGLTKAQAKSRSALRQHTSLLLLGSCEKLDEGLSQCPSAAHITPTIWKSPYAMITKVAVPFGSTHHSYLAAKAENEELVIVAVPFGSTHHSYYTDLEGFEKNKVAVPFGSTHHSYP